MEGVSPLPIQEVIPPLEDREPGALQDKLIGSQDAHVHHVLRLHVYERTREIIRGELVFAPSRRNAVPEMMAGIAA
jgi:hypothetical protein